MKQTIKLFAFIFLISAYSCSQNRNFKEVSAEASLNEQEVNQPNTAANEINTTIERKVIKEGEITFETASVKETQKLVSKTVVELKGYISQDQAFDYKDKIEHHVTIRVPAEKFDILLYRISQSAEKLEGKNINALDVTEEFIDVELRIKTKKKLEDRYIELLKQAGKVDDILKIEKEIGALRTEIESMEGRLRFLKDKISLSTLTVIYYERTASAFGFNSKFGQAIKNGWNNLLWFIIALTNLWPFLLVIVTTVIIIVRFNNKSKKKSTK